MDTIQRLVCNVKGCDKQEKIHVPFSSPKMEAKGKKGWQCLSCKCVKWLDAETKPVSTALGRQRPLATPPAAPEKPWLA